MRKMKNYTQPFNNDIQYCTRCCMPETSEGITFDEMGICSGCRSSEMKMRINWAERQEQLTKILDKYRSANGDNYDCLVPISGGKDSTFQLHILTQVYRMKPLAVTFSHNWYSETGKFNLWNTLEKMNVDHVMFTPNRGLVNKLAKKALYKIGDPCWHCHAGIPAFTLQTAVKFQIPLIIWGESIAEFGSKATYEDNVQFDEEYYLKVSSKVNWEEMLGDGITKQDLKPFMLPTKEELEEAGVWGIHLGDYLFWDGERQTEFIKEKYGWREDVVQGTYKGYKSVECIMPGVHDYAKYIKRGFGRGTDHATLDVRAGIMSRAEGLELARKIDSERPPALDYYLEITGMDETEFINVLKNLRTGKAKQLP